MPGAPRASCLTNSDGLQPNSFLLLVVRPGAPSSILAPSRSQEPLVAPCLTNSDGLEPNSFLLLVVRPGATSSSLLLLAMPGAPRGSCLTNSDGLQPNRFLAPSSNREPLVAPGIASRSP